MVSTADDMLTWLEALLGGKVLSPSMLEQAMISVDAHMPDLLGSRAYGLGLTRQEVGGDELRGHGGGFIGFTAWALHSPKGGYAMAVAGNLSGFDVTSVIANLQQVITSERED